MSKIGLILLLFCTAEIVFGQKKLIDFSTAATWPECRPQKISDDGKYICYTVGSEKGGKHLFAASAGTEWKRCLEGGSNPVFTADSHFLIYRQSSDTLCILDLLGDRLEFMPRVADYKIPASGNGHWMVCQSSTPANEVVLRNLENGAKKTYEGIADCLFNDNGSALLLHSIPDSGKRMSESITLIETESLKATVICQGYNAGNFVFDPAGAQLAFLSQASPDNENAKAIRLYKIGQDSSIIVVDGSSPNLKGLLFSNETIFFSRDGNRLFYRMMPRPDTSLNVNNEGMANVDVWNYKDNYLQEQQLANLKNPLSFLFDVNLRDGNKIIRIQSEYDDYIAMESLCDGGDGEYALACTDAKDVDDYFRRQLNGRMQQDIYLVSMRDGSRKQIQRRFSPITRLISLSPRGKYVLWYDLKTRQWFTFNIANGVVRSISGKIPFPLYYEDDRPDDPGPLGTAAWVVNDSSVLVYDRYDIWSLDPNDSRPPENITNGYGRKNGVILRYLDFVHSSINPIDANDTLVLSAFNPVNKQSGFYRMTAAFRKDPEKLIMAPEVFYFPKRYSLVIDGLEFPVFPIKAKLANTYVLRRMSSDEFPNLVVTTDFKNFRALTDLEPQKDYNWYTSELIHWHLPDGKPSDGMLFKPENFDPGKKYPIIFYYYEQNSDAVHFYISPAFSQGDLNIPLFVSRGYVVFVPDIHYTIGHPGQSACDAVLSAASYLKQTRHWVDDHKMGLQGHSFGGFETNYIIGKTQLFAAAASAEGAVDFISMYSGLLFGPGSGHFYFERRQGRIGKSLWQEPGLYIENSPLFKADKINTPLLIMQNKGDLTVPWITQGVALFTALKSFDKKVWLLQYDGEEHTLLKEIDQVDYSIRLEEFFGHFLKDLPSPPWMEKGVPANRKGKDTGY
ncbi:MAG: prolyl oligopeptidase family serine peptidase [Puia sp.]|nr:prolyl oligopeptidase family serine peptidase [Puia sp.]